MRGMVGQVYGACVILSEAKDLKTPVLTRNGLLVKDLCRKIFHPHNNEISYFSRFSRMARMKSRLLRTVTSGRVVMRARSLVILPWAMVSRVAFRCV